MKARLTVKTFGIERYILCIGVWRQMKLKHLISSSWDFISSRLSLDENKPAIKVDRSIEWLN